jgi:hypothetical protein
MSFLACACKRKYRRLWVKSTLSIVFVTQVVTFLDKPAQKRDANARENGRRGGCSTVRIKDTRAGGYSNVTEGWGKCRTPTWTRWRVPLSGWGMPESFDFRACCVIASFCPGLATLRNSDYDRYCDRLRTSRTRHSRAVLPPLHSYPPSPPGQCKNGTHRSIARQPRQDCHSLSRFLTWYFLSKESGIWEPNDSQIPLTRRINAARPASTYRSRLRRQI